MTTTPEAPERTWQCSCGHRHHRVWWTPPERLAHHPPRWVAPTIDPCSECQSTAHTDTIDQLAHEMDRRQRRTGIAQRDRAWSFDRLVSLLEMTPAEGRERLQRSPKGSIGITPDNQAAIEVLTEWRLGAWVYLYGEPGAGKTVLASALASSLVQGGEERWQWRDPSESEWHDIPDGYDHSEIVLGGGLLRMVRRPVLEGVVMITDDELWSRCTLSWSGDRDPLHQVFEARVLIIDDLGTATHQKALENVQRLIAARYRDELSTVITSNLRWADIEGRYGRRVASRLEEQVPRRNRLSMRYNWRSR